MSAARESRLLTTRNTRFPCIACHACGWRRGHDATCPRITLQLWSDAASVAHSVGAADWERRDFDLKGD